MHWCCLLLAVADSPRPRDPWVIRSVLDNRPRMVTIALHKELWIAYDAANCGMYKTWRGDVAYQGAVYDANHGPTPTTRGTTLLAAGEGPAWTVTSGGSPAAVTAVFSGYSIARNTVTLQYTLLLDDKRRITIRETPEVIEREGSPPALQRRLEVGAIPDGMTVHAMLGLADRQTGQIEHVGAGKLTSTPQLQMSAIAVEFDQPGTAAVTFRWTQ